MAKIDLQGRAPGITRTPDFRNIVQRRYDVLNFIPKDPVKLLADCWLPLGTTDTAYTDCYLTVQKIEGQNGDSRKPCEDPPVLLRQFEQLNGLNETQTDNPAVTINQYGYKEVTIDWAQLSLGTATYQVPGTTAGPAPFTDCILRDQVAEDNGTLRTIKRTYVAGGELSDVTDIKYGGKLLVRTLRYLNPLVTPTLAGYTLTATNIEYINGLKVVGYVFTAGGGGGGTGTGGIISIDVRVTDSGNNSMDPAADDNVGVNITTIRYLTELTQNTPLPATYENSTLIDAQKEDDAGYRIWTTTWVNGNAQGSVVDNEYKYSGAGGGSGLVIYHRIGLGVVPETPSAELGGTVSVIKNEVRQGNGYVIYDYTWAEGVGVIEVTTRSRDDGSIEHVILTLSADQEDTPAPTFPAAYFNYGKIIAGTAVYCVSLKNDAQDGYYLNTATWIEPPTNRSTEKRTVTFTVPGLATAANPPTFSPPISRRLLSTVFEYWGTTPNPNSDTPYTITSWAQLEENYEIADTGQQVSNITALDGYVGSSTITGSNTTYRGIDVTSFATAVGGSSPTTKPTGLTVLDLEWEPYLTDINGVIVWKTTALKFTF